MISPAGTATRSVRVVAARDGVPARKRSDTVTVEEPLELRLESGHATQRIAVTMRTPGNDLELAAGFVLGEGIVPDPRAIAAIRHCDDAELTPEERGNVVTVVARSGIPAPALLERHFTITSACGVCGSAGIELLRARGYSALETRDRISAALLAALPDRMRERQRQFDATGGLHAAALFALDGALLALREDVGRHNAVDKIAGWAALGGIAVGATVLVVSGRCSYEIVQKALVAGIPFVASVSAPSSLAIDLAERFGITLAGFVRHGGWNAYARAERIVS